MNEKFAFKFRLKRTTIMFGVLKIERFLVKNGKFEVKIALRYFTFQLHLIVTLAYSARLIQLKKKPPESNAFFVDSMHDYMIELVQTRINQELMIDYYLF